MASTICCRVRDVDLGIARPAGEWAEAFHPGVAFQLNERHACLTSAEHSEDQLRLIWLSSLANERLHAHAGTWRAATLTALMQ